MSLLHIVSWYDRIIRYELIDRITTSTSRSIYRWSSLSVRLDTIAWRFLLPKQLAQNGPSEAHVQVTEPALLCAIVSLLTGKCVPPMTALTGEVIITSFFLSRSDTGVVLLQITLRGRVSPVGGIKENMLSVHHAGANRVILPWANWKTLSMV